MHLGRLQKIFGVGPLGALISFGLLALHVIWHALVRREEATMYHLFGETYRTYASRTGRFLPRWPHRRED